MIGMKILFTIVILPLFAVSQSSALKVAIIGGGIGGASSAYHLRELFGSSVSIHLFDGGPLGGRVQTIDMQGKYFESGGSVIHVRNRYMRQFANLLNLTDCDGMEGTVLTIFNGVKPAFVGSEWSWLQTLKLLWRYGPDLIRIKSIVSEMLDQFDNIYQIQTDGKAFADLESLITSWNSEFSDLLKESLTDHLRAKGLSERFIDELANAGARCNYNQRTSDIHAFVGLVSMAGFLPGVFCIKGGNDQIIRKLLKHANVKVTAAWVSSVEETSGTLSKPLYSLNLRNGLSHDGFDFVILAAPRYQNSPVPWPRFVNVEPDLPPIEDTPYQPVTATFVDGELNVNHFRLSEGNYNYAVLMSGRASTNPVNSVAIHSTVEDCKITDNTKVWKVFSNSTEPLSSELMKKLFSKHSSVKSKVWHGAYPRYSIPTKTAGRRFMIAPGLICLHPIEQLASAMEMSAIAGANAALLVNHSRGSKTGQMHGSPGVGRGGDDGQTEKYSDEL